MNKHESNTLLSNGKVKLASSVLRALSHPLRLKIISTIEDNGGKANVGHIFRTLKVEQSIVSQHLRILRQAKLVSTQRDQKFVYYSLEPEKLVRAANAVANLLK